LFCRPGVSDAEERNLLKNEIKKNNYKAASGKATSQGRKPVPVAGSLPACGFFIPTPLGLFTRKKYTFWTIFYVLCIKCLTTIFIPVGKYVYHGVALAAIWNYSMLFFVGEKSTI